MLADGDGRDLSRKLRRSRPDLATLFISGYAGGVLGNDTESEVSPVLYKPFSSNELLQMVATILGDEVVSAERSDETRKA